MGKGGLAGLGGVSVSHGVVPSSGAAEGGQYKGPHHPMKWSRAPDHNPTVSARHIFLGPRQPSSLRETLSLELPASCLGVLNRFGAHS